MKPDEDECWREGRDAFCAEHFPDYPRCSWEYQRCVECLDDGDCSYDKKYCTWDKRCVECEVDGQCPGGDVFCIDDVCRMKNCADFANEGFPDYCKDREPETPICDFDLKICVECISPSDCDVGEDCIDSVCVEEGEKDCVDKENEGVYDYCSRLYPNRPICHSQLRECVECQFDTHCGDDENCVSTSCIGSDWDCEIDEDCISDRWKCERHECILKICSDYDDPDAFCDDKYPGWRCREDGVCVKCLEDEDCPGDKRCANNKCWDKTCDEAPLPDLWCRQKFGNEYKCIDGECKIPDEKKCSDFLTTAEADGFCEEQNSAKPFCDWDSGQCEECVLGQHCPAGWSCSNHTCIECFNDDDCFFGYVCKEQTCVKGTCADVENPDNYCVVWYGFGYTCVDMECVLTDCAGVDDRCPEGFFCPDTDCVWGCRDSDNCPGERPHCSQETNECEECLGPVHCGLGYDCINHVCVEGVDCQHNDKLCPENEYCNIDRCEPGCRNSDNCGLWTPHCSQATVMCEECVYDLHCEAGYDCDNYLCVWVGYDCGNDSECPKNWMCHDQRKECIFGCENNDNCSDDTPHCSLATGNCEECWSSTHCLWWQDCDNYVCVAKPGYEECVEGDTRPGYRCRDGVWVRMECLGPEDCLGHESCIDGLCIDNEHECEDASDCIAGYYCDITRSYKCKPQICMEHFECGAGLCCGVVGQGGENGCESCLTYPCKALGPCPAGWICDKDTGFCREAMCDAPFDCGDPKYFDCIEGFCIGIGCGDAEDQHAWCREERGWYYRCLDGNCILLSCGSYSDPDMMCIDLHGESYRCEGNRCIDKGPGGTEDPDKYCVDLLGMDEAFWNYETEKCDVPDCDTVQDPDKLCAQLKDERYKCRDGECRRGREGEECENYDECMPSLGCKEGICVKYECYNVSDCEDDEWCVDHVCIPMNNECNSNDDCRDDYFCDENGICVPDACNDHYDCGLGYCCNEFGMCVPCDELTCVGNFDCRMGWRCNMSTSKCERAGCQRDSDCDSGYYCDLDDGECKEIRDDYEVCWFNWDCPSGQVCKGQYVDLLWPMYQLIPNLSWGQGICVDEDVRLIQIKGVDDDETCDYCREMWKKLGREGEFPLPPYHEHCRCYGVYL